ncbi:MAG TPA: phospholipase D-like domain-containing protein [Ktedonobacteraceae bacterium]|nr:phospholipase D-like domain-containing protein [Ktedonobacteraceae bacterium]
MLRRLHHRKVALISLLILALSIFLTAYTFAPGNVVAANQAFPDTYARRHHTPTPTHKKTPTPVPTQPAKTPVAQSGLQLFVEPAAGEQVILNAINNAQQSVWLETYLLTDTNIINALEKAAGRIQVRVMLEPHPYGGGSPQATLDALKAAGASTEDSSPSFTLTHEKGMIVDGNTAFIMTCNFTYSALNGKNREYGIIDTNTPDVQNVIDIFNADWNRTAIQPSDPGLVVSPTNSRTALTTFINDAKSSLIVEAEEMQDTSIEQAIVSAAQRGVKVQVILPTPSSSPDANAAGIATIKAGGAQVEEDAQLYMHAKMMVADGSSAFVGSENISSNSLDNNRELGLIFSDTSIIGTLQTTFQQDWSASQPAVQQATGL